MTLYYSLRLWVTRIRTTPLALPPIPLCPFLPQCRGMILLYHHPLRLVPLWNPPPQFLSVKNTATRALPVKFRCLMTVPLVWHHRNFRLLPLRAPHHHFVPLTKGLIRLGRPV